MNIKLIKNEADYQIALDRLELLFNAKSGSIESDEADILGLRIMRANIILSKYYKILIGKNSQSRQVSCPHETMINNMSLTKHKILKYLQIHYLMFSNSWDFKEIAHQLKA